MTLTQRIDRLTALPDGRKILDRLLLRAEDGLRLVTKRGKAKGGGQSSKAKGRQAVVGLRDRIVTILGIPEAGMMVKATSMPGVDLYIAPEHRARFPFSVEVKACESLQIWAALAQARENVEFGRPALFFKRAGTPMFVTVDAETFLGMQADLNFYQENYGHRLRQTQTGAGDRPEDGAELGHHAG